MQQIQNANKILERTLKEKSTREYFEAMCRSFKKSNASLFATSFQTYVTRLGLAVSKCIVDKKMVGNNFRDALRYLCKDIADMPTIYGALVASKLNTEANGGKHTLANVDVDIKECILHYNRLIVKLIEKTSLDALKMCIVKQTVNIRNVALFDEKDFAKSGIIGTVKYKIGLPRSYFKDEYEKTVNTLLMFKSPKNYSNRFADIEVYNESDGKLVGEAKEIDLSRDKSKNVHLKFEENQVDRRIVRVIVRITIWQNVTVKCNNGKKLFGKKEWTEERRDNVGVKEEPLSQLMRTDVNDV